MLNPLDSFLISEFTDGLCFRYSAIIFLFIYTFLIKTSMILLIISSVCNACDELSASPMDPSSNYACPRLTRHLMGKQEVGH